MCQVPSNDNNWNTTTLLLNENFNGNALNTAIWQLGRGWDDRNLTWRTINDITLLTSGTQAAITTEEEHDLLPGDKVAFDGIYGFGNDCRNYLNSTTFEMVSSLSPYTFVINIPAVVSCSGTYSVTPSRGEVVEDNYTYHVRSVALNRISGTNTIRAIASTEDPFPIDVAVGDYIVLAEVSSSNGTVQSNPAPNSSRFTVTAVTSSSEIRFNLTSILSWPINTTGKIYFTKHVKVNGASELVLTSDYDVSRSPNNNKTILTGSIISRDRYHYGYYEIRCKWNADGNRYLPAFWTWWTNGSCDDNNPNFLYNENDFFEGFIDDSTNTWTHSNNIHHFSGSFPGCDINNGKVVHKPYLNLTNSNYHVFGYEWTPGKTLYYVDNILYDLRYSPFVSSVPSWINVNLGMQYPWGGATRGLGSGAPNYTKQMTVDYIKVYELKRNCVTEVITNFNSTTFVPGVRSVITLTGDVTTPSSTAVLRANEFLIQGNFTAELGDSFILLPTVCY
jgi:hypothetical protein